MDQSRSSIWYLQVPTIQTSGLFFHYCFLQLWYERVVFTVLTAQHSPVRVFRTLGAMRATLGPLGPLQQLPQY